MKKALLIGNNNYPNKPLSVCLNDVDLLCSHLSSKEDNYNIMVIKDEPRSSVVLKEISNLFSDYCDTALLYFSGHGCYNGSDYYLAFPGDSKTGQDGLIDLKQILGIVINSPARQKIIILDSCFAGGMGIVYNNKEISALPENLAILTACKSNEKSYCGDNYSKFTEILCHALSGAAADYAGNITINSLYSYVEKFFGEKEQRPIFKINATESFIIKKVPPRVPKEVLERTLNLFPSPIEEFQLDPSFEPTNLPNSVDRNCEPYANPDHVSIFGDLQVLESIGLVAPSGVKHMYFAAMYSKSCHLLPEGRYLWDLAKKGLL